jgi:hypothetical protein
MVKKENADPFARTLERSSIAQCLSEARASLAKPSRPYTPMDRSLFADAGPGVDFMSTRSSLRTTSRQSSITAVAEDDVLGAEPPAGYLDADLSSFGVGSSVTMYNDGDEVQVLSDELVTAVVAAPPMIPRTPDAPSGAYPPMSRPIAPGRPRSRASTREKTAVEDSRVPQLLAKADALLATKNDKLNEVWEAVIDEVCNVAVAASERALVANMVVRLLEAKPPCGALRLARVGLQMPESTPGVARMLFKLSKDEKQDDAFRTEQLLEPILQALAKHKRSGGNAQLPVYLAGVLKNVSHYSENQAFLVQQGGIKILTEMLLRDDLAETKEKQAAVLVQVAAGLRNLAIKPQHYRHFVTAKTVAALLQVCDRYLQHRELLSNIARILAKLSLQEALCEELARVGVPQLMAVLNAHSDCTALVLRVTFCLGNVTAKDDDVRQRVMEHCGGADLLPQLLATYMERERNERRSGAGTKEAEEVIVKVVRLLANVCISESIGSKVCANSAIVSPLLDLLGSKTLSDAEELVLNVVAAVTNLCFYDVPGNILFSAENKQLLCRLFRPLLLENYNPEALVEATRALGNITRHADARAVLVQLRVDEVLAILLEHTNRDLVFYLCGVLVNLAADPMCAQRLAQLKVVPKLIELLEDAPEDDTELALCACKVLANMTLDEAVPWVPSDLASLQRAAAEVRNRNGKSPNRDSQLHDLLNHLATAQPRGPTALPS